MIVTGDLNFSQHILDITNSARKIVNCIFRCFVVRNPEFYIRLYVSLVVSRLLYCCPVWLPHKKKHIRMLQVVQSYFLRRVHLRCALPKGTIVLPHVEYALAEQDLRSLGRLISIGLKDQFFTVRRNSLRSKCTISPKELAKTDTVANMFSWRICSKR